MATTTDTTDARPQATGQARSGNAPGRGLAIPPAEGGEKRKVCPPEERQRQDRMRDPDLCRDRDRALEGAFAGRRAQVTGSYRRTDGRLVLVYPGGAVVLPRL